MIQIAIVDDESRQIKIIQQSIQNFFRQKIEKMTIASIPFTVENPCFRAVVLMT